MFVVILTLATQKTRELKILNAQIGGLMLSLYCIFEPFLASFWHRFVFYAKNRIIILLFKYKIGVKNHFDVVYSRAEVSIETRWNSEFSPMSK